MTQTVPGIPDIVAQPLGIHSADARLNYEFHNWNHVYLFYCTSDSSLGDFPASLLLVVPTRPPCTCHLIPVSRIATVSSTTGTTCTYGTAPLTPRWVSSESS